MNNGSRPFRKYCLLVLSVFCLFPASCRRSAEYVQITGYAQGGTYSVKLNMKDSSGNRIAPSPQELKNGIDSILTVFDNSVSGYNASSLLSRFNRGESIIPDRIFSEIYKISYRYYMETGGLFDVSSAPLYDIWGFGFTDGKLPSDEEIRSAMKSCGMSRLADSIVVDSSGMASAAMLVLSGDRMPELNYNAIAQGYSCDLLADYLHGFGVKDMLIDVGGEIYCEGCNPSGTGWGIGLDRPEDGNMNPGEKLQGVFRAGPEPCGVVTSGNYRKFYVKDGRKYAHTIDPGTGYPVTHSLLSATVFAGNATEADALATYCMVLGLEGARDFISSRDDLEGCLVYDDSGEFRTWVSDGLDFSAR